MAKENDKKLGTPKAIIGRVGGKTGAIDATGTVSLPNRPKPLRNGRQDGGRERLKRKKARS